jgi:hypothetical protein
VTAPRLGQLSLEGPDGILVPKSNIVFNLPTKYDIGVVVLLHATRRTVDICHKPFIYTIWMKYMLARKLFIGTPCLLLAYRAQLVSVHLTFSITPGNSLLFTFLS